MKVSGRASLVRPRLESTLQEGTMPDAKPDEPIAERELVLVREIDAPREKLYRCWTDPELLKPWFCPKPWQVTEAEMDVRVGGKSYILMQGPNGETFPNRGVYL